MPAAPGGQAKWQSHRGLRLNIGIYRSACAGPVLPPRHAPARNTLKFWDAPAGRRGYCGVGLPL